MRRAKIKTLALLVSLLAFALGGLREDCNPKTATLKSPAEVNRTEIGAALNGALPVASAAAPTKALAKERPTLLAQNAKAAVPAPAPAAPILDRKVVPNSTYLKYIDYKQNKAVISLDYDHPIAPEDLKGRLRPIVNNLEVKDFTLVQTGGRGLNLELKFANYSLENNELVMNFLLDPKGVGKKDWTSFSVEPKNLNLGRGPVIVIQSVDVTEGANGFFFSLECGDYSERDHWRRCEFATDELKAKVHLKPAADATIFPEQRGFKLFGNFKKGDYALTVDAGLVSKNGGRLTQKYETTLTVPLRAKKANFAARGRYLPAQYLKKTPIRAVNVEEVEITVRKISEQNLVYWLSGEIENADDRVSDFVAKKTFKVVNKEDVEQTIWIDLAELAPKKGKGVYQFTMTGGAQPDATRLVLSKLALIAKRQAKGSGVLVWALDLETMEPLEDVEIKVMTKSSSQLATKATNEQGLAAFENLIKPDDDPGRAPFAVIAKTKDDLSVFKFDDLEIPLTEYAVSGDPYAAQSPYQGAVYSDRGVYRPGETARLVAVIWEPTNRSPQTAVPVVAKLVDPRGREVERISAQTNPAGLVPFDLKFQDYSSTGKYNFTVEIGGKPVVAYNFLVEEFVPERMKVTIEPKTKAVLLSESPSFTVSARYLFGAKAKGEKLEATCQLQPEVLKFDEWPGFEFGVWRQNKVNDVNLGEVEALLDDEGGAVFSCPKASELADFKGPARIKVMAAVFEAGSGRTTVADASIPAHPDARYVGLKSSARKVSPGEKIEVEGLVADWDGKLVATPYQIELEYLELQAEWAYEWNDDNGGSNWRPFFRESMIGKEKIDSSKGRFKTSFVPKNYAYGVVVRARSGARALTELYIKGDENEPWWDYEGDYGEGEQEVARTPKPQVPEGLRIETAATIGVGKAEKLAINLPYPGRLLLTLETDKVISSEWIEVDAGRFEREIKLDKFAPNVYVSALLIKDPFSESKEAFMPARAFGVTSVRVDPKDFRLDLKLTAPAELRPNAEFTVKLDLGKTQGPAFATVAVVDEGVLQLTRFKSPDPLDDIHKKRGLGVSTFETVGWSLLAPPPEEAKSTGGDADEGGGLNGRIPPVKPVALWSGLVAVDGSGKAEIKFQLPLYRGQVRVMAVAAGSDRIGTASADVLVREPLVVQTTLPRFLLAEDVTVIPVFLTNATGKDDAFNVELTVKGGATALDPAPKSISLAKGASGTVPFLLKATQTRGAAEIEVVAKGGGQTSIDRGVIPLLPNGPSVSEQKVVKLEPGENDLTPLLQGWDPQYEQTTFTIASNRYLQEMGHLSYLIQYPYGCIEQTTSYTRPLLFISNLLPSIAPEAIKDGSIQDKFMHGIRRLFSMQTSRGGFSYWPGNNEDTYWGTAYVTHLMLEGIEAGYPIDRGRLDQAIAFMENTVAAKIEDQDPKYQISVAASEPYMLFALAKAGKFKPKKIQALIKKPGADWGELKDENLYLLKAALYMSGDRTYEADLKKGDRALTDKRRTDWSFWSALRSRGMILNIMEDLFPGSAEAEPVAVAVAERLRQGQSHSFTTQELSWCVSGLGKRGGTGASKWSDPRLSLAGKDYPALPKPSDKTKESAWQIAGASGLSPVKLKVDEIVGGSLWAFARIEGMKPGVVAKDEDNGLKLTREYKTADGEAVDPAKVKLGDLFFVQLTLQNLTNEEVQNIALVDRVAAGFDIENPRLNRDFAANFIDEGARWELEYLNIRDDRIELFGKLGPAETKSIAYPIRAVVGGRYQVPPAKAEAMYDPRINSQRGGGSLVVHDPWNAITD